MVGDPVASVTACAAPERAFCVQGPYTGQHFR